MDNVLDGEAKIKLMKGCGRGCFNRHQFKKDIVNKGNGSLEKLIEAYSQNFEMWKKKDKVHIRYCKVSKGCYCPAENTGSLSREMFIANARLRIKQLLKQH